MDWCDQVTIGSDLYELLCSHNDVVYLLVQSNCTELQTSINILYGLHYFLITLCNMNNVSNIRLEKVCNIRS